VSGRQPALGGGKRESTSTGSPRGPRRSWRAPSGGC